MSNAELALVDIGIWPLTQLGISAIVVRLSGHLFANDTLLTRPYFFEKSLRLYRALGVPRWKKHLPDGGYLVGGHRKWLSPFVPSARHRFLIETRRAEVAHWLQIGCACVTWLWNPLWACILMTGYGILSSVPCILAQRYNRIRLQRRAAG